MVFDPKQYSPDWPQIRQAILTRAGNRCEQCGAGNGEPHPVSGSKVVLTCAHLNHERLDNRPENLRAWCQRCHLNYDRSRHLAKAKQTRARLAAASQRDLFDEGADAAAAAASDRP